MPIYSDDEAEAEDRLASVLAGAGATSSLAAAAAAALKEDPKADLPPRLKVALESIVHVVERTASLDISVLSQERLNGLPFPEELVANLARQAPEANSSTNVKDLVNKVLADLRALLKEPAPDVAGRVEMFLAALSQSENSYAQSLARGSLDLEFLGTPAYSF
jgi:hypothetical protein